MKKSPVSLPLNDFINNKNIELLGGEYSDERILRFRQALEGMPHNDDGSFALNALESAWQKTESASVH